MLMIKPLSSSGCILISSCGISCIIWKSCHVYFTNEVRNFPDRIHFIFWKFHTTLRENFWLKCKKDQSRSK